jgi:hypothetical protein
MRGVLGGVLVALAAMLVGPALARADVGTGHVRAGVAVVDASWHVGASAGQYASDGTFVDHEDGTFDPTAHSVRRRPSYGVQSRLSVRALVIEGPDGTRVAVVKNDLYIPQDLVYRRAGQLLEGGECGIDAESLTMAATHNHSSPFYSSTSWGVWTFQDVFDIRFFNYMAERMARAVERACDELVPVRVGASVGHFAKTARHSFGPAIADDGTPAGYPHSDTDPNVTVIRFDDVSDPDDPRPLANLVNFSLHPEFLEGNDLISADYLGPLERMVDRATGAVTVWTQGAVGTAEPERSTHHPIDERLEFSHKDYAQAEYGARLMADAIVEIWGDVERGTPAMSERFVPFDTSFPVRMADRWYAGPFSHPYPGVSNCRTDPALGGDPRLPIVGLPDCVPLSQGLAQLAGLLGLPAPPDIPAPPVDPGLSTDDFQAAGIPVPENYSAPAYTGLHEDINVHLQGIRLGEIYLPVCSCEQWYDQSENVRTRTDKVAGNEHLGFDWGERCEPAGDGTYEPDGSGTGTWVCPSPHNPAGTLEPISDRRLKRMRAQVRNAANGWNDLENVAEAESEPVDPREIKGNYTHDDRCGLDALTPGSDPCGPGDVSASAELGYTLTVPISMANDYNGYIATYREYQRGDHYRKALTGWGAHSSDYMATRMAYIGRELRDPRVELPLDMRQEEALEPKVTVDLALNERRAEALGEVGGAAIAAFEAGLPDDGGEAEAVSQPADVERFDAALFAWNGGSNFTDDPQVRVERDGEGGWELYADQSGEVPVTLELPEVGEAAPYLLGDAEWRWTAHFEAFASSFDPGERPLATPAGRYRFVVEGSRREGGERVGYRIVSDAFRVRPWSGITVEDIRLTADDRVSFRVGPRSTYQVGGEGSDVAVVGAGEPIEAEVGPIDYPDSYDSPARFIDHRRTAYRHPDAPDDARRLEWFCFTCTFRPWVDSGDAESAVVTIERPNGKPVAAPAFRQGDRWVTERRLRPRERASVAAGDVRDAYGNLNGEPSATVEHQR